MTLLIILLVIVVLLVGFVVMGFNKLRSADVGAQEALGGIDVQLTRRADLIPNLVATVQGYAAHEKGLIEEVTRARAGALAAAKGTDVAAKAAADAAMDQAMVKVNAVAEAYPDLKANTNFLELQKQLASTEDQISFARQYYNDAVAKLNTLVRTIPWMFFTGIAGVNKREFYEAPEGHAAPPQVDFGAGSPAVPPAPAAPEVPATPQAPAVEAPPATPTTPPTTPPAPPTTPPTAPAPPA